MKALCSFRCMIGIHKWKQVGIESILNPMPLCQCIRCGIGETFIPWGGTVRYTKEAMNEALRAAKSNSPSAGDAGGKNHG